VGAALKSLEYRGYDSWGMVWREAGRLASVKRIGKVPTSFTFDAVSRIAVGHTRWATHGGVTDDNAHPHLDSTGRVAIVHNGIVENAPALRRALGPAISYASETDSEIVAHLLGQRLVAGESIVDALRTVFPSLHGQNAIIAIDQQEEVIAAAMNVSPLVIGLGAEGSFISSDPFALIGKATEMIIAPADAVVRLGPDGVTAVNYAGESLPLPDTHPVPDLSPDELGPYDHFMAKEMDEQPATLRRQIEDVASTVRLANHIHRAQHVVLTGCGSAYYASRIGATWLTVRAGKRAMAIPGSEFNDVAPFLGPETLVIAVTQSGETADILEAMRIAKVHDCSLVALVNVLHSSAARLADDVIPLAAGRERSVLATKSMMAMVGRLLATVESFSGDTARSTSQLARAAAAMEELDQDQRFEDFIDRASTVIAAQDHVYVIGKGDAFGVAQEAALKIKEASYVHAEAFAAGELKHGAIALIEPGTPCLVFATEARFTADTGSSAQELHSRGGYTMAIGLEMPQGASDSLVIPDLGPVNTFVHIYVAQRLAYAVALARNLDPDYPRNLAKSVTVK
jgi:glucosamine--fructose-6-phosphate aminotransferase (isomerizing)